MENNYQITRRRALKAAGSIGIAGLAGCADSSSTDTTPQPTKEETGYEVIGYEVEDNLDDLEDGEELEITAKRILENQDGDKKTETLETNEYQVKGETIRYHEQVEDSILKEAGLYRDLKDTVEQTDNSYSFSSEDLIAGKNLLTLEIQINDTEYGNQETYQDTGEIQIKKDPETTKEEILVENHEIYDHLRDKIRSERMGSWIEIAEETGEKADLETPETTEELYQEIADNWIDLASDRVNGGPSGQANYLADTLEKLAENTVAGRINNVGHNTVLAINEEENRAYHVDTGASGRTANPPGAGWFPMTNKEDTPLFTPETRPERAKGALWHFITSHSDLALDHRNISEETAFSFMNDMREDKNTEELLDSIKTIGATTSLSPNIEYQIDGNITNPEITATS